MWENNNSRMGFRDGLPIGVGYVVIALAVGLFSSSAGLSWYEALLLSALNLTSAGQIAAIPIIATGGSLVEIALTQLVINSRYALMSISLSQRLGESVRFKDRFLIAFFNTDELFAISCAKDCLLGRRYFLSLVIYPYAGWCFGTLLGALLGGILPPLLTDAFSVAIYAMFIAIVIPATRTSLSTLICIISAALLSSAFEFIPALKVVNRGIVIVIITVVLSAVFAVICPISEHDPWEVEAENG